MWLLSVVDEKIVNQEIAELLAQNLRDRHIAVETIEIHGLGETIGEVLQTKALELHADLMVMGGFGHSRLREFVLGGATRSVLGNVSLPLLLSH